MKELRFITGPFRPDARATREAWRPLAEHLASLMNFDVQLTIAPSWDEVGMAMERDEFDLAWMGGAARYVHARSRGAGPAIATVHFAGSPVYRAIVVAAKQTHIEDFPANAKGRSMSFTHRNSTTGWLVPFAHFVSLGIDPTIYFDYRDGASHPENLLGIVSGKFEFSTDHDNNRNAMIARGEVDANDVPIVWASNPVPQDPLSIRNGLDESLVRELQCSLTSITGDLAASVMPRGYTGFSVANDASYSVIRDAAALVKPSPPA